MAVYLDHAATSPIRPEVAAEFARHLGVVGNPSAIHSFGQAAGRLVEEAREELAAAVGCSSAGTLFEGDRRFDIVVRLPESLRTDIDAIRRSRLKKKTLFEMDDEDDIITARAEYLRLADTLWRSVNGPGSTPDPLPDRDIFELLGFD